MRRVLFALKVVEALFAINFAAILVVGLVLAKEGLLSRERVLAAVRALRGAEGVKPTSQPSTTAPSTLPAATTATQAGIPLADRTRLIALVRTDLEREIEEVRQRALLVEEARKQLERDRAAFEAEREAFRKAVDPLIQAQRRAGLRQLVKTLSALKPPRIKTLLEKLPDEELVLVLLGLEPRLRGKVIAEFNSAEELERMRKVMELIRRGVGSEPKKPT